MDTNKVKGGELGKKVVRFWDCLLDRGMFISLARRSAPLARRSILLARRSAPLARGSVALARECAPLARPKSITNRTTLAPTWECTMFIFSTFYVSLYLLTPLLILFLPLFR